jgi:hypothetical protein
MENHEKETNVNTAFGVLTAVTMGNKSFWDVRPCHSSKSLPPADFSFDLFFDSQDGGSTFL